MVQEVFSITMQLTQKEKMLLQDQKSHEEICVQKYQEYANRAKDPQLKQLFNHYAGQEQQHLNTINQILSGQVPSTGSGQGQQQGQAPEPWNIQAEGTVVANQGDAFLCSDMLMTEKYVSDTYDTSIFESTDTNIRQALNHIQKEEQQHGEGIFKYMQSRGMYNPQ